MPLICVLFVSSISLMIWSFFGFFKNTDAYQGAFTRVKASSAVVQALGSPIKDGFMFTAEINITNDTGHARLSFPVSGPKGSATVFAEAELEYGRWHYDVLIVTVKGQSKHFDISDRKLRSSVRGNEATPPVGAFDGLSGEAKAARQP